MRTMWNQIIFWKMKMSSADVIDDKKNMTDFYLIFNMTILILIFKSLHKISDEVKIVIWIFITALCRSCQKSHDADMFSVSFKNKTEWSIVLQVMMHLMQIG